ncbi:amidase family protein [Haliangium sp.]|uniref:amidase family protein n=1 Tax=Haliangium sp. TaxID=2663208 RepID=UPI003D0E2431
MTNDIDKLDAIGQAELVANGQVSALELVDAAIVRIEAIEPRLHALASHDFDAARRRAQGELTGPFAGVPFLVKDLLPYPGQRLTFGSRLFSSQVAENGSAYTDRLDGAGLITLGKSTTSELGLLGSTEALVFEKTVNPWMAGKSAMGSSGGAAAAVAAGLVPVAHASDGGGSIRLPASACGLFGFKPGRGRLVDNGLPDAAGLIIEHCVSRSVRDSAQMLAITEAESDHPVGFVREPSRRRLRIAVYDRTAFGRAPDPSVTRALERTVALCRELGHECVPADPPALDGPAASEAFFTLGGAAVAQLAKMVQPMLGRDPGEDELEPFTLSLLHWFRSLPEGATRRAIQSAHEQGQRLASYLESCDVALCPTMPIEPPDLGTFSPSGDRETLLERTNVLAGYTAVHNMAGVPAMSVPLFVSDSGLPIGSQFAARTGAEATLLALAYELEEAAPWQHLLPRSMT